MNAMLLPDPERRAEPDARARHIDVVNTSRRFGDFLALDGVDLHVHAGEIVGILGPNGAGKSTLLRACEGLEPVDQGRILVLGRDITVERDAAKGHVGLVLQRPRFSGYATVRETVHLFASFRGVRDDADRFVDVLGLTPKLDVRIAKLSGGERQRLAVAIGLMGGHEILLLDEPTSELDPQARRVVWQLVSMVARQRNCAVLMTTHQMEEAEVLCDRVYVIDHGRIIASGNPAQVIVENCDSMAVCFMLHGDAAAALKSRYPDVETTRHGQYLKARKQVRTVQEGQQVMRDLLERFGDGMIDAGLQRPNLEDVFIKLTGAGLRG